MAWIFLYIIPYIFNFTKNTSIEKNRIWDSDRFTPEPFNLIILNKLNVEKIEDNIYKFFGSNDQTMFFLRMCRPYVGECLCECHVLHEWGIIIILIVITDVLYYNVIIPFVFFEQSQIRINSY